MPGGFPAGSGAFLPGSGSGSFLSGSGASRRAGAPVLDDDSRTALHAQAVSVLNVKALVPIILDVNAANFTRWRGLFLVALGKYDLTDHVLSDAHHPANASWLQMDCVALGWLYGTISADLLQEVMAHDATARSVWRALELQFRSNSEQRALNLTVEFRTFHPGDLSVNDYCRRMKAMADSLADLGDPVTDRGLVLATLNGLSAKFENLKTIITMQCPFPSFADVRSQLLLEELSKASRNTNTSTVLLAGTSGGKQPTTPNPAHATGFGANTSNNNRNRQRRGGGGGNSGTNNSGGGGGSQQQPGPPRPATSQPGSVQAWPSPYNPWAGTIQMWPGSLGRGVLGPRPVSPFAGATLTGPPNGFQVQQQAPFPAQPVPMG
ncbi:uncharacterized protein LOC127770757 [Oryza glaberrima]|uniref:uncharacterized protein LOC127770757 n=1 Tax=Oryza glaberrima TaxID=4538 RepID=UPI00224C52C9|nr:uncharacterized protein LOC127770757 [Oryza glaberrima]